MRLAGLTIVSAAIFAATAASAGASPLAPDPVGAQAAKLIPVAEGCGFGWHRNYWGACIPNRVVRIYRHPRDEVIEEEWDEYDDY